MTERKQLMKKYTLMAALAFASFGTHAVKIKYDEKHNIIPTEEVCASVAASMTDLLNWLSLSEGVEKRKIQKDIDTLAPLFKRCIDAGFISN